VRWVDLVEHTNRRSHILISDFVLLWPVPEQHSSQSFHLVRKVKKQRGQRREIGECGKREGNRKRIKNYFSMRSSVLVNLVHVYMDHAPVGVNESEVLARRELKSTERMQTRKEVEYAYIGSDHVTIQQFEGCSRS
jgi:hypothetical protein